MKTLTLDEINAVSGASMDTLYAEAMAMIKAMIAGGAANGIFTNSVIRIWPTMPVLTTPVAPTPVTPPTPLGPQGPTSESGSASGSVRGSGIRFHFHFH